MDDLNELRRLRRDVPAPSARALDEAMDRLSRAAVSDAGAKPAWVRPRLLFAAGIAMVIAGTLVVAGVTVTGGNPITSPANASEVLRRAAAAASADEPAPGQFVYSESRQEMEAGSTVGKRTWNWIARSEYRIWYGDGGQIQASRELASVALPGRRLPPASVLHGTSVNGGWQWWASGPCKGAASLDHPTYAFMKSLPADPARLRAYLRTHIPAGVIHAPKGQPQVPENIRLVATVVDLAANQAIPPALRVGLFRVLETMPGLSVERDVVDGIGRHGIAVVMSAVDAGVQLARVQIVFDRKSYAYLGMRTILTADDKTRGIPAGVVSSVTVVRTAIVDGAPTGHNVAREPC